MFRSLCLALLILAGANPAFAGCTLSIFKESPAVPDARSATLDEMKQAVVTIQKYIHSAEKVLDTCDHINTFTHNIYVGRLKALADDINRESDIFSTLANSSSLASS